MEKITLRGVVGTVAIVKNPKQRAIVHFEFNGKMEKALLKLEQFAYQGSMCQFAHAKGMSFKCVLNVGDKIKFVAHPLHNNDPLFAICEDEICGWYIAAAWNIEEEKKIPISYVPALSGVLATICNIDDDKRCGILSYESKPTGIEHYIKFVGSRIYKYGRRLSTKIPLSKLLTEDIYVLCDAAPYEPQKGDNDLCSWFATSVYIGPRPTNTAPCDDKFDTCFKSNDDLLKVVRTFWANNRAVFVKGRGQVMKILNDEFGIALLRFGPTQWKTTIFHRSRSYIDGICLHDQKLGTYFEEGDEVRLICVSTLHQHQKLPFTFVACQLIADLEGPFHVTPVGAEPLMSEQYYTAKTCIRKM